PALYSMHSARALVAVYDVVALGAAANAFLQAAWARRRGGGGVCGVAPGAAAGRRPPSRPTTSFKTSRATTSAVHGVAQIANGARFDSCAAPGARHVRRVAP